jgi:hypothetical protein
MRLNKGMINATTAVSSPGVSLSFDLKSLFCSKASLVKIAAAVSIAIFSLCLCKNLVVQEEIAVDHYTTQSDGPG